MMTFKILFTVQANKDLEELENNKNLEKRLKAVRKTLAYLQIQHISESFRQDEFQGEPAERILIREQRRILQNSLVSSFMECAANPRHPSLNTHKYKAIKGNNGEEIFEVYAENNTPAAYRIFWHYGPKKDNITILTITAHP